MADKVTVVQNDSGQKFIFTIKKDGRIESLLGATVHLHLINKKDNIILKRECIVTDPSSAECTYVLTHSDLAVPGNYITELQIQYSNGTILTKVNPILLVILPELVSE